MNDSFADLWNASAPTKPAPAPKTLGSLNHPGTQASFTRPPQYDAFSRLSASQPASRTNSPLISNTSVKTNQLRNVPTSRNPGSVAPPSLASPRSNTNANANSNNNGDAFSGLFASSNSNSSSHLNSSNGRPLTIAERAAMVESSRFQRQPSQQKGLQEPGQSAWDGIDLLAQSSPASRSTPVAPQDDFEFAFSSPSPLANSTAGTGPGTQATPLHDDDWGLSDFGSQPSTSTKTSSLSAPRAQVPQSSQTSQTLWDLDEFMSPSTGAAGKTDSNSDFELDFGREDRLLNHSGRPGDESDDDVLGDLAKPIGVGADTSSRIPSPSSSLSQPNHNSTSTPPVPPSGQRHPSPPPHIIGQIVEMGFSPQQARAALAVTGDGKDVQAALEMLLAGSENDREVTEARPQDSDRRRGGDNDRRRGGGGSNREESRRPDPADSSSPVSGTDMTTVQIEAEKIIAQASELGISVFNRAGAFWRESKEKAQRLYEERAAAAPAAGGGGTSKNRDSERGTGSRGAPARRQDGRPRWMRDEEGGNEVVERENEREGGALSRKTRHGKEAGGGFSDDVLPPKAPKSAPSSSAPPEADLLSPTTTDTSTPAIYISPFRRGRPKQEQPQYESSSMPIPPSQPASPSLFKPAASTPTPRFPTPPPISPPILAASNAHKARGTAAYKLGQHGAAETAYSASLAALPDVHVLRIPVFNNRALARLKMGEYAGAVEDCSAVLTIVGSFRDTIRVDSADGTKEEVDLGQGMTKALRRRAEAHEGREKWALARADWEMLAGLEWAPPNVRSEAVRGAGRCRRMVSSDSGENDASIGSAVSKPQPKPKPRPRPAPRAATTSGGGAPPAAVSRLREAITTADAEADLRLTLKDSVDARINAWKGGKETNIRALLASLDTVLWPELGWVKVGMAELLGSGQVKVRYMKAIGRLHPDKLNAQNTTVEQRMIANAVFGTLNEAWNAFQQ
ncbi:hypothetical protein BJ138DRAFT_1128299 [Hygrophoropsis aurantiaca]|uniref:Uncharacterized protein n=1 Tax=Hygrophoropsis aurantiaca TaxID=72124 RepID=A0ACB8A7H4_9AGAM|nr:hypothetical protein BJ138DRAFT_1128299 [Hygrophoropsis aurantiaca]